MKPIEWLSRRLKRRLDLEGPAEEPEESPEVLDVKQQIEEADAMVYHSDAETKESIASHMRDVGQYESAARLAREARILRSKARSATFRSGMNLGESRDEE